MIPVGNVVFPFVSSQLDGTQFQALEALFSAAVGFGLSSLVG
jgi:hypothetical protein